MLELIAPFISSNRLVSVSWLSPKYLDFDIIPGEIYSNTNFSYSGHENKVQQEVCV